MSAVQWFAAGIMAILAFCMAGLVVFLIAEFFSMRGRDRVYGGSDGSFLEGTLSDPLEEFDASHRRELRRALLLYKGDPDRAYLQKLSDKGKFDATLDELERLNLLPYFFARLSLDEQADESRNG